MRELDQNNRLCEQIHIPKIDKNDIDFMKKSFFTIIINQILSYYTLDGNFIGFVQNYGKRVIFLTFI